EVSFPVANGAHKYVKFRRRLFDWAIVAAAAQQLSDGSWRIGITNAAPTPVRRQGVEQALAQGASPEQAAEQASEGLEPSGDVRATPEYKLHLARVLTKRAIQEATAA
ncbi:MAG TPA: xanthine dehydrogenase family protein subunit M, partial [Candidatus Binatia bacterium]|nr:xanthine dehydrogenase family protein subunit M [Candidatus Binatia bacterium]